MADRKNKKTASPPNGSTSLENATADSVTLSGGSNISISLSSSNSTSSSLSISSQETSVADQFSRQVSPVHWTTMSDTIAVSPGAVPILKGFCGSLDALGHHNDHSAVARCKSASNLEDSMKNLSDEEVRQMRDRLVNFARNRALFLQLGRGQKLALAIICLCYFTSYCAISVMAPFFLDVAKQHEVSTTTYAMIFSVHPFVVFTTSPFIGKILPSIGPKFMFVGGVFLCGACNLLFGVLDLVEDDSQFVALCFLVRGLSAVGASAFATAGATFVAKMFPDKVGAVMGILETFVGLGFSVGPVIGGALYSLGDFSMPFFVLGALMLTSLPFGIGLLPETDHTVEQKSAPSFLAIFRSPSVLIVCLVITVSSSAWSVLDPTLAIHMKQFDLPPLHLGLLFLVTATSYALSSPFWGWLADKYDHGDAMMVTGLSFTALSLFLLGPSSIFPGAPNALWLNIFSLVLLGIFDALAYLPTYQALLQYARDVGCDGQTCTYSVIAGLWASMYSLGEVIGPTIGGFLMDVYDFPTAVTAVGFLNVTVVALILLHRLVRCLGKLHTSRRNATVEEGAVAEPLDRLAAVAPDPSAPADHRPKTHKQVTFAAAFQINEEHEPLLTSHSPQEEASYGSSSAPTAPTK